MLWTTLADIAIPNDFSGWLMFALAAVCVSTASAVTWYATVNVPRATQHIREMNADAAALLKSDRDAFNTRMDQTVAMFTKSLLEREVAHDADLAIQRAEFRAERMELSRAMSVELAMHRDTVGTLRNSLDALSEAVQRLSGGAKRANSSGG